MFNEKLALVLTVGKEAEKWIPVKYLVKHGLYADNVVYLEDKGYLLTMTHSTEGTMVRLTLNGYYEARKLTDARYTR